MSIDNSSLSFDLLSVGDATVDIFLNLAEINHKCHLDRNSNELCIKYGEKILVEDSKFMLGGNACNVAVGVSRLNVGSGFVSELGDDEFSRIIINGLKKENVDISLVGETKDLETNFAIILTFEKDKVLFARHIPRKHNFSLDKVAAKWVYLTSMGKEWKEAYQRVLDYTQKTGAKLAFNPGTVQINEGLESFKNVIEKSDILFLNKEEAEEVLRIKDEGLSINKHNGEINKLLQSLKAMGPKIMVITDNNNGSYALDENGKIYHIGIFPGEAVQKTGAGDAYTSGFLSAIISGGSIRQAMKWGAVNSSAVIQKVGAQTGLLTKEEIEDKVINNTGFAAIEI